MECNKCEHKEYCEDEKYCLLDYSINKIKEKGRKSKQDIRYYKSKKQNQLIYLNNEIK